jgi:hypothetical protein
VFDLVNCLTRGDVRKQSQQLLSIGQFGQATSLETLVESPECLLGHVLFVGSPPHPFQSPPCELNEKRPEALVQPLQGCILTRPELVDPSAYRTKRRHTSAPLGQHCLGSRGLTAIYLATNAGKGPTFRYREKNVASLFELLIYLLGLTRRRSFEIEALNPEKKKKHLSEAGRNLVER